MIHEYYIKPGKPGRDLKTAKRYCYHNAGYQSQEWVLWATLANPSLYYIKPKEYILSWQIICYQICNRSYYNIYHKKVMNPVGLSSKFDVQSKSSQGDQPTWPEFDLAWPILAQLIDQAQDCFTANQGLSWYIQPPFQNIEISSYLFDRCEPKSNTNNAAGFTCGCVEKYLFVTKIIDLASQKY